MNLKEIKEMINLMNENNLTELEIEREGIKIKISKQSKEQKTSKIIPQAEYVVDQTPQIQTEATKKEEKTITNVTEIKSPMVGTLYRAPSPETPPFIELNQNIEIGQVVCIIEAMKLMNEIKSEVKGKIKEILVENGDPVEFGQPLFLIEPS